MRKTKIFIIVALLGILCNGCGADSGEITFDVNDRRENVKLIERGEGEDVCIISSDGLEGDAIIPGKFLVLSSVAGESRDVDTGGRLSNYSRYKLHLYELENGKLAKMIDVNKILEQEDEKRYQIEGTASYNTVEIEEKESICLYMERIPNGEDDSWKTDRMYLNIDVNTDVSSMMTTKEAHAKVKRDPVVRREMSIFDEWGKYSLKDANGFPSEEGKDEKEKYFYVSEYPGWEGMTQVWMTTDYLPKENKALYNEFPQLKEYQGKEGMVAYIYFSDYPSAEEIFKLFMEEGQEVSFDGAWLDEEHSIDGQKHFIHSFEEYYQWRK